jgi:HSP20 family protein
MGNKPKHGKRQTLSMNDLLFPGCPGALGADQWFPPMDLGETETQVVVRIEVAGVAPGDLRVTIRDDVLAVSGLKREPQFPDEEKIRFLCLERGYGPFQKTLELQWVIDPKKTRAVLENGVLTVTLAKRPEQRGTLYEIPIHVQNGE